MQTIILTLLSESHDEDNFINQRDCSLGLGRQLETPALADPRGTRLSHGKGPLPAALVN